MNTVNIAIACIIIEPILDDTLLAAGLMDEEFSFQQMRHCFERIFACIFNLKQH